MHPSILFSMISRLPRSRRDARIASFSFAVFATTKAGTDHKRPTSLSPTAADGQAEAERLNLLNPGSSYVVRPIVAGMVVA